MKYAFIYHNILQTSMHYYSALNALQYKRKVALLEPLIGLMQGKKAFFQMGKEATDKTEIDDFLSNTLASVQGYDDG
jgi:DCC-interacting protein 13 alpha